MKPIALVDLDDTLFQTRRKIESLAEDDLVIAARATNGSDSYMTPTQAAMASWLLASTEAIPVTARGSDAYGRVTLAFTSYAILANGAVILGPDGEPIRAWRDKISAALHGYASSFDDLLREGNARAEQLRVSIRSWSVMEDGMPAYVVFKENDGDGSRLQEIAPHVEGDGWVRHHNGNNLALIPPAISKRLASAFLIERLLEETPGRPVIGFGDSVTDLSYLSLCDWWGAPRKSQLTDLVVKGAQQSSVGSRARR